MAAPRPPDFGDRPEEHFYVVADSELTPSLRRAARVCLSRSGGGASLLRPYLSNRATTDAAYGALLERAPVRHNTGERAALAALLRRCIMRYPPSDRAMVALDAWARGVTVSYTHLTLPTKRIV